MQDFIPVLAFIVAYVMARLMGYSDGAMYIATIALMVAVAVQILWLKLKHKPVERRVWLTAVVIWVLGTITLVLHNPLFVQLKPTILNFVIAGLFLGSQWVGKENLTKKMLRSAFSMPDKLWMRLNLAWVAFFVAEGMINAVVAFSFSYDFWVGFKLWGLMGMTFLFLIVQFIWLRQYIQRDAQGE
ncbi:MAG: intracellular septation protein A [Cardiobacteriales bacterium]|nr:MAG: intracellular septation protein A [Cardiobacteriales bacterium]